MSVSLKKIFCRGARFYFFWALIFVVLFSVVFGVLGGSSFLRSRLPFFAQILTVPPSGVNSVQNVTFFFLADTGRFFANKPVVVSILPAGSGANTTPLETQTVSTANSNVANQVIFSSTNLPPGPYDVQIKVPGALSRKQSFSLSSGLIYTFTKKIISGDLNGDNSINSLDWSLMSGEWFKTGKQSDVNGDGVTNALDFAWLNKNWFLIGDTFVGSVPPVVTPSPVSAGSLPHIARTGVNLITNPHFNGSSGWALSGDVMYDTQTSRTSDGSGSYILTTPYASNDLKSSALYTNGSFFIPVVSGKTYTLAGYIKTQGWPNYVSLYLGAYDSNKKYIANRFGSMAGTTGDNRWEEVVSTYTPSAGDAFVQIKVSKGANPTGAGQVWLDDMYFGEGPGFEQPPTAKTPFNGSRVRVDALGNIELNKNGTWTPFFPLCMYTDNSRDLSVYSVQGWNCNMWTGTVGAIQAGKNATSVFNPDGLMSGFDLASYTSLTGYNANNQTLLRSRLEEIQTKGLMDHLLFYYLDNENNWDDWVTPPAILNLVKSIDAQSASTRQVPIYILQGTYGAARTFASTGLSDVVGTYVGTPVFTGNNSTQYAFSPLGVLQNVEGQTNPVVIAQFNDIAGTGEMRQRLYDSIISGARGMGFWRDCFSTSCLTAPDMQSLIQKNLLGPVDGRAWWSDFPNLRREIDSLMPLIRQPHWTTWSATLNSNAVLAGTRDYQGEGYLFVVNQTTSPVLLSANLQGMTYTPTKVVDFFTGQTVAQISNNSFSFTVPAIGIKSGTGVYRLMR